MAGSASRHEVAAAIAANNFPASAGHPRAFFIVSNVSTNTDFAQSDQFKRMIVKARDGGFSCG